MQPLGDAEAYGHSLKDDKGSDAVEDELDELEKELDAEEQQQVTCKGSSMEGKHCAR